VVIRPLAGAPASFIVVFSDLKLKRAPTPYGLRSCTGNVERRGAKCAPRACRATLGPVPFVQKGPAKEWKMLGTNAGAVSVATAGMYRGA
jgi:hypothetical protein